MRLHLHRDQHHREVSAAEPVCPRFHAVQRWVLRHLETVQHERQVAAIASNLFDLTRPLHGLSLTDRRLLRLAALVHDVGRCISKKDHPSEGARMLREDNALPITADERRALAYLTRYHRGPVPPCGHDEILHRRDDPDRLLRLLGLLRTADALDSRSLEPARLVFALAAAGNSGRARLLCVTCYLDEVTPKADRVYRRRKKFRLLEELLDVRVEVEIDHAEALRLVA
jgi:putative nucleotidyltransferase with HDIG domain